MTPVTTAKEAIEAAARVIEIQRQGMIDAMNCCLGTPASSAWATINAHMQTAEDAIRAIPVADPVGVTVKPLEWQRNGNHWAAGHGYVIRLMGGRYTLTHRNRHEREFGTLEAAQAAADIDHEHYIRSCLTVADDPRVSALVEAALIALDDMQKRADGLRTALAAFAPVNGKEPTP